MMEFLTLKEAGVQLIDCVHKTPKAETSGCFYIAIPQMKDGRIETADARLISEEDFNKWTIKANPQKWDIVLSRRCNPGVTSIVTGDFKFALGQNLVLLRSDGSRIFPPYLKWLVNSQYWWEQISKYTNVGAVFESLRCADVPNFILPIPKIEVQKEISKTLENIDQKIILLRQQNQDLEELAQTLFKLWFVKFEFPNENGEPYHSSGGKMVESELGEIPEGWRYLMLRDVIAELIDNRGKTPEYFDEGIPALSAKYIKQGKVINQDSHNYVSQELFDNSEKLEKGDIVMTSEAPLGELYYVAINTKYYPAQRVYAIRANNDIIRSSILYYWLNSFHGQYLINRRASGTTVQGIKQSELLDVEILVPDGIIQNKMHASLNHILLKKEVNENEIQTLTQLRDTLLPKLMSGELRVKK